MPTFGYLVYLLRVNSPYRPNDLDCLSAAGDSAIDLLDSFEQELRGLGVGYHREDKTAEGFRIKSVERAGRAINIRINKGPQGGTGEAYNIDSEESIETGENQALLSGLHAMFVVPADSYFGLLFVERVGVRHLKDLLARLVIRPACKNAGVVTRIESFAELKDWRQDLQGKQTLRVSEVLAARVTGEDASTVNDTIVKVVSEGNGIRTLGPRIKDAVFARLASREKHIDAVAAQARLRSKRQQAGEDAFTVQDEADYQQAVSDIEAFVAPKLVDDELGEALRAAVPLNTADLQHRRFEVGLGDTRGVTRNIVVESDAMPQFVYELGGRLNERILRATWVNHAESLLRARQVILSPGWDRP